MTQFPTLESPYKKTVKSVGSHRLGGNCFVWKESSPRFLKLSGFFPFLANVLSRIARGHFGSKQVTPMQFNLIIVLMMKLY